jgi:hypothetical protein
VQGTTPFLPHSARRPPPYASPAPLLAGGRRPAARIHGSSPSSLRLPPRSPPHGRLPLPLPFSIGVELLLPAAAPPALPCPRPGSFSWLETSHAHDGQHPLHGRQQVGCRTPSSTSGRRPAQRPSPLGQQSWRPSSLRPAFLAVSSSPDVSARLAALRCAVNSTSSTLARCLLFLRSPKHRRRSPPVRPRQSLFDPASTLFSID